jgi:membrane protease YdiL (CAAX protease family)
MRMDRKRSLLLIICYGFLATLAVFYGLVERQSLFVTIIVFHLIVCLGIPFFHGWWEGGLREHWRQAWQGGFIDKKGAAVGVASGFLLFMGVVSGIWLLLQAGADAEWIRFTLRRWGVTERWLWLFAIYMIVGNSLLEELLWRGFVLQRLLSGVSRWKAILASSFFFALYHLVLGVVLFGWVWGAIITCLVFAVGVVWACMKYRYPSVYPTWFSHLFADFGLITALFIWIY